MATEMAPRPKPPAYEHKITLGNLLQILVIIVGGLAVFFRLEGQVALNAERIASGEKLTKTQLETIRDALADIRTDLRSSRVTPLGERYRVNDRNVLPSLRQGALEPGPEAERRIAR